MTHYTLHQHRISYHVRYRQKRLEDIFDVYQFSLSSLWLTVSKLLNNISSNKSTGLDGVPIKFLKMCEPTSSFLLTHLINLSLKTNVGPNGWKRACLTPLFKDGDPDNPSNYRPIAILPASSKILERIVHEQVMSYVNTHKILSKAQFGSGKATPLLHVR